MAGCIVTSSKDFKALVEASGLHPMELEARMKEFMDNNNTEDWPSLEQLGIESKEVEAKEIDNVISGAEIEAEPEIKNAPENVAYSILNQEDSTSNEDQFVDDREQFNEVDETIQYPKSDENINYKDFNGFKKLIDQFRNEMKVLNTQIGVLNSKAKKSSGEEYQSLSKQIESLKFKVEKLKNQIIDIKTIDNVNQLLDFADDAVSEISSILNSNKVIHPSTLRYMERMAKFWIEAGDFNQSRFGNPLFGKVEMPQSVIDAFSARRNSMSDLNKRINAKQSDYIIQMAEQQLGGKWTPKKLYLAMRDANAVSSNVFNISDFSHPLLSTIFKVIRKAEDNGRIAHEENMKEFSSVLDAAKPFLSGKGDNRFKMFLQDNTGKLVTIYSQLYHDTRNKLISRAIETKSKVDWNAFNKWSKENEMYMDLRLLFPDVDTISRLGEDKVNELRDAHLDKLKKLINNDRLLNQYLDNRQRDLVDYQHERMTFITNLNQNMSNTARDLAVLEFELRRSPYVELDRRLGKLNTDGTYGSTEVTSGSKLVYAEGKIKGLKTIPLRQDTNGKATEWYDKKYNTIAQNKETLELYDYMFDLLSKLKSVLPAHLAGEIDANALPYVKKSLLEAFRDNKGIGMAQLLSSIQDSFTVKDLPDNPNREIDINTGKEVSGLKAPSVMLTKERINSAVAYKVSEYVAKNGTKPSNEKLVEIRQSVIDDFNKERSFDLEEILKIYSKLVTTYEHKAIVNDIVKISQDAFNNRVNQIATNKADTETTDSEGNVMNEEGLKNIQELLDFTIRDWQGNSTKKIEGVWKEKTFYSVQDKERLSQIIHLQSLLEEEFKNNRVSDDDYTEAKEILSKEYDQLGGHLALSAIGDNLLKYTQVKGMGFNAIAGGINLIQGWMENSIRAADGRFFDQTQLNQALRAAWSATFDPFGKSESTRKLIGIEKALDIQEEQQNELFDLATSKFITAAYKINKKTEFVNMMSFTGAYLRNIPVVDNNGAKSNLYEAFDDKGNIKDGWKLSETKSNKDFLFDVQMNVKKLLVKSHGNYWTKMKGKEQIMGRALLQFRSWMPEMYASRFAKVDYDPILQTEFKGRYRSYKVLGGSTFEGNQYTAAQNCLYTLGQLGRKIAFMRTSFDGRMNTTDAANMRANLMELHFAIGAIIMTLILKGALGDDDDKQKFIRNMALNVLTRTQTDIWMYANPMEMESLSKNFLPVMGVISDTQKVLWSVEQQIAGRGTYTTGSHRHMNKILVNTAKMVPLENQFLRLFNYGAAPINVTK